MCADAAQTDPYFAESLCGGGAGERAKILAFSAFLANLAVFGPLEQFWTNLAKLALFGNFWDFRNFGQILRDFAGTFGPFAKCPLAKFGFFLAIWAIFDNFGGFWVNLAVLAFRHFRHFWPIWPFLAHLGNFGNFRQIWQFLAILEIFPILVKF